MSAPSENSPNVLSQQDEKAKTPIDAKAIQFLIKAMTAYAQGDTKKALILVENAKRETSSSSSFSAILYAHLSHAVSLSKKGDDDGGSSVVAAVKSEEKDSCSSVYDIDGFAFEQFIEHGGNVLVYQTVNQTLQTYWKEHLFAPLVKAHRSSRCLEIGVGGGKVFAPLIEHFHHLLQETAADGLPELPRAHFDLVEPSQPMLQHCQAQVAKHLKTNHPSLSHIIFHACSLQDFLKKKKEKSPEDPFKRYDLAQATFAMSAIPPKPRQMVLKEIQKQVKSLCLVEFDVEIPWMNATTLPHLADEDRIRGITLAYQRGVEEYKDSPYYERILRGFLCPVYLGYFNACAAKRTTFEQSAASWKKELTQAGFHTIEIKPLCPYWWSPAVLIHATNL